MSNLFESQVLDRKRAFKYARSRANRPSGVYLTIRIVSVDIERKSVCVEELGCGWDYYVYIVEAIASSGSDFFPVVISTEGNDVFDEGFLSQKCPGSLWFVNGSFGMDREKGRLELYSPVYDEIPSEHTCYVNACFEKYLSEGACPFLRGYGL